MKLEYPAKIILAWGEAITGNQQIREWLMQNGYAELGVFAFALNNREEARQWLMDNNHPHLMALIRGAEGDPNAILWLKKYDLNLLALVARAADNDDDALHELIQTDNGDFAALASKMRVVKNGIERDNNDVHKYNIG
ncbi:MAG: hypothetical protein KDC12_10230 [Flavobacteriales bacterium]|nr:hypothetical protein [Flavobacteriales bacterium]